MRLAFHKALILSALAILLMASTVNAQIIVNPSDDLQALVDANPTGTIFYLAAGYFEGVKVLAKDGNQFLGQLGPNREKLTTLSGATVVSNWQPNGAYWMATGQTQEGKRWGGLCDPGTNNTCDLPEQVFINGVKLQQVPQLLDVNSGSFFFDYANDRIFIGQNPSGKVVKASVTPFAFRGPANNVVIKDLVVEMYAAPSLFAAVDVRFTTLDTFPYGLNWRIENNLVQDNHGIGIRGGTNTLILGNSALRNGQFGITGDGDDLRVSHNTIAYNNTAGYLREWGAGGTKFVQTNRLVADHNSISFNEGYGLWTDIDNDQVTFRDNLVVGNFSTGILHEISYSATIVRNHTEGNGFGYPDWGWGGGIVISASGPVQVNNNTAIDNADGIVGIQQPRGPGYELRNSSFIGNCIKADQGWTGIIRELGQEWVFSAGNVFSNNTHEVTGSAPVFHWWGTELNFGGWAPFHSSEAVGQCPEVFSSSQGFESGHFYNFELTD